jgi:hypothetical protein
MIRHYLILLGANLKKKIWKLEFKITSIPYFKWHKNVIERISEGAKSYRATSQTSGTEVNSGEIYKKINKCSAKFIIGTESVINELLSLELVETFTEQRQRWMLCFS